MIHRSRICDPGTLLMEVTLQYIFTPNGILIEEDKDII